MGGDLRDALTRVLMLLVSRAVRRRLSEPERRWRRSRATWLLTRIALAVLGWVVLFLGVLGACRMVEYYYYGFQ